MDGDIVCFTGYLDLRICLPSKHGQKFSPKTWVNKIGSFFCLDAAWLNEGRCPGGRTSVSYNYFIKSKKNAGIPMETNKGGTKKERLAETAGRRVGEGGKSQNEPAEQGLDGKTYEQLPKCFDSRMCFAQGHSQSKAS